MTEKNLMWAAIAVLALLAFCPSLRTDKRDGRPEAMRERMGQMRGRMGSKGDSGKGAWVTREALVDGEKKGRKRGPKKDAE